MGLLNWISSSKGQAASPPPALAQAASPKSKASSESSIGMTEAPLLEKNKNFYVENVTALLLNFPPKYFAGAKLGMRDPVPRGAAANTQQKEVEFDLTRAEVLDAKKGGVILAKDGKTRLILVRENNSAQINFDGMTEAEKAEFIDRVKVFDTLEDASKYITENAVDTGYDEQPKHEEFKKLILNFYNHVDVHKKNACFVSSKGMPLIKIGDVIFTKWTNSLGDEDIPIPAYIKAAKEAEAEAKAKAEAKANANANEQALMAEVRVVQQAAGEAQPAVGAEENQQEEADNALKAGSDGASFDLDAAAAINHQPQFPAQPADGAGGQGQPVASPPPPRSYDQGSFDSDLENITHLFSSANDAIKHENLVAARKDISYAQTIHEHAEKFAEPGSANAVKIAEAFLQYAKVELAFAKAEGSADTSKYVAGVVCAEQLLDNAKKDLKASNLPSEFFGQVPSPHSDTSSNADNGGQGVSGHVDSSISSSQDGDGTTSSDSPSSSIRGSRENSASSIQPTSPNEQDLKAGLAAVKEMQNYMEKNIFNEAILVNSSKESLYETKTTLQELSKSLIKHGRQYEHIAQTALNEGNNRLDDRLAKIRNNESSIPAVSFRAT